MTLCFGLLIAILILAIATAVLTINKPPTIPIISAIWIFIGLILSTVAVVHFCGR